MLLANRPASPVRRSLRLPCPLSHTAFRCSPRTGLVLRIILFLCAACAASLLFSSSSKHDKPTAPPSDLSRFNRNVTHKDRTMALFNRGPGRMPAYPPIEAEHLARLETTLTDLDSLIRAEYQREIAAPPPAPREPTLPLPKTHIIIHLPKTGGTTWGLLARRNEDLYKFKQFWYHIAKTDLPFLPRFVNGTVFGHFRYGTHLFFPNSTYSYVTMLRNPVERVLSHYFYHLTEPKDPNHALAKSMTLEQWINASKNAHNRQVQFVAGLVYEEPTRETLAIAKHHLRHFGFVGLTERFDDTIVMLSHYLGWNKLKYFIRKQTREKPGKDKIEPRILELIRERNSLDMELYELAVEMFDRQVALLTSRGIDLEKEFRDYKAHK